MGRSVDYLSNAEKVTFFDVSSTNYKLECGCDYAKDDEGETCDVCGEEVELAFNEDNWEWDDFVENVRNCLTKKYSSLSKEESWDGDETKIILGNALCEIGISEYIGIASLSIRVCDDAYGWSDRGTTENLAFHWIDQNWSGMLKELDENVGYGRLDRIRTFSNGEGVYERTK